LDVHRGQHVVKRIHESAPGRWGINQRRNAIDRPAPNPYALGMQSFRINNASSVDLVEEPVPVAGAGEVLVRIRAASLNARDRILLDQVIDGGAAVGKIALSDGAGVVESVGERATRFQVGDRVVNCFHPMWFGGVSRGHAPTYALELDGWLTEFLVVSEQALLRIPDHLSFEEAATLPC